MRHLEAGPPEAALDVESLVVLAAVEYCLITPNLLGDVVERLDDAQAQLLALLVFGDRDVLDVADGSEVVDAAEASEKASVLCLFLSSAVHTSHPSHLLKGGGHQARGAYNLRSASRAPVPTMRGGLALVSSMTSTK